MAFYWIILLLSAFFARSHGSCGVPPRLDFAALNPQFVDQDNFPVNTNVNYTCRDGYIFVRGLKNYVTCLNDSTWSTPEAFCTLRSCGNPGEIQNGKVSIIDTLFGSRVNFTCDEGYNMLSRRPFRECQADGTWSNEVPVCEVQKCPPPNAIADGSFQTEKEEYDYQDAVQYKCSDTDKRLTLIGKDTLSCTAYGNWSSDPPHCIVVECPSPNVDNAEKVSGFTGPYILNSAVRFQCLPDYTMVGDPSVKCNVSSMWDPPLPTCRSRVVTKSPATTKQKETETGGTTATQKPTIKEKDEENGGGNHVGAIVGNTLIIVTMTVLAFVISNGLRK